MSETPGFNPDEAKAEEALKLAKELDAQRVAEEAEAKKTGDQNLEIPEGEIDDLFGDLEKGDGEEV